MRPQVDFAILSRDRIDSVILSIESALAQRGVDGHVYVVDQDSKAADFARLDRFCAGRSGVTLVRNARNTGVSMGRNQAIAMGSAPYIIGIDDDARIEDGDQALRAVELAASDPTIGAVAFRLIDTVTREPPETARVAVARAAKGLPVLAFVGAGYLLRRSVFEAVGRFDDAIFFYHEEGDLSRRIINAGYRIAYAPNATMLHPFPPDRGAFDTPRRGYYHVRNSIYLAAKYNLSPLAAPLIIARVVGEGLRHGYYAATLRGILGGLGMVPRGLRLRLRDPRVRLSAEARRVLRSGSPTADMSLPRRLAFRMGIGPQRG